MPQELYTDGIAKLLIRDYGTGIPDKLSWVAINMNSERVVCYPGKQTHTSTQDPLPDYASEHRDPKQTGEVSCDISFRFLPSWLLLSGFLL